MWTCPKCERKIKSENQWHYCAKVNIDSLFEGKQDHLIPIFNTLLSTISDWPEISVSATKNCIVFVRKQTFLVVRPMKKELDLKFYLPYYSEEFPIYKSLEYSGKFETHIRISDVRDLDMSVFRMIRGSYDILKN